MNKFEDAGQIEGFPKLGSNSEPCPYIRSSAEGTHWCALAAQPADHREVMNLRSDARLRAAAQAVLDRWDLPAWEWLKQGSTAALMTELRAALGEDKL